MCFLFHKLFAKLLLRWQSNEYWLLRRILVNIHNKVYYYTSWNIQVYKLSHCYHLTLLMYLFNKYL
jgi:hypothetical protein